MVNLDQKDIDILCVLASDGRLSKVELARRVNLTPSPCWERLDRLERLGVINGYQANVILSEVMHSVTFFVTVSLEDHGYRSESAADSYFSDLDFIVGCWHISGEFDYLLQIIVPGVLQFQKYMEDMLAADIGVSRYFSFLAARTIKQPNPVTPNLLLCLMSTPIDQK